MKINKKKAVNKFIELANKYIQKSDELKSSAGRPRKFSNTFFLRQILNVLIYGYTWSSLTYNDENIGDTVRKRFYDWRDKHIFSNASVELTRKYKKKIGKKVFKTLYIDSTTILNFNGTKGKYNGLKFKGKKTYNLTVCCDENRIMRTFKFHRSNMHDSKAALKMFKNPKLKNSTIIGDSGYILNKQITDKLKSKCGIKLITNLRSNMKRKVSDQDKKKLKKRIKIENYFAHIKRGFRRLNTIMDRSEKNLNTWMTMCHSICIIRYFVNNG